MWEAKKDSHLFNFKSFFFLTYQLSTFIKFSPPPNIPLGHGPVATPFANLNQIKLKYQIQIQHEIHINYCLKISNKIPN